MKKAIILLAAASAALVSCNTKIEAPAVDNQVTLTAVSEQATKTSVDGSSILWGVGDAIKVFAGTSSSKFTSTNAAPSATAQFTGSLNFVFGSNEGTGSNATLIALYPYSADAVCEGQVVTATVPAEQVAPAGSYDPAAFLSMAKSESFNLQFYNVCGGIKFKVSQAGVKTITLTGAANEAIAGTVKIQMDAAGKPVVAEVVEAKSSLTVTAAEGTFATDTYYYVATLPVSLAAGFTATFSTGGSEATRTASAANTIARSKFSDFGVADTGLEYKSAVEVADIWTKDAAGEKALYGNSVASNDAAWLSYEGGKVKWTANTTGAIRKGTITLDSGSALTVTQVEPADLKGDYTYKTKIFSKNTSFITAANAGTVNVTFGNPILGETLTDAETNATYTNQLGISGLYFTAIMDASVVIDYENKTAKLGLFCDARDNAQPVQNGVAGYNYVAFLPGLGTKSASGWGAAYNFLKADLGTEDVPQDYCWIWFKSTDLVEFSWNSFVLNGVDGRQFISRLSGPNCIVGISVVPCNSTAVNASSVYSNWDVVYQANYNNSASTYTTFTRK